MFDSNCEKCKSILDAIESGKPPKEQFSWCFGIAVYDIDKARQISKNHKTIKVPTSELVNFIAYTGNPLEIRALGNHIYDHHIDHVCDSEEDPIILAMSPKDKDRAYMPIDGNHRIAKALKMNQEFVFCRLLTEQESDEIITDFRKKRRKN